MITNITRYVSDYNKYMPVTLLCSHWMELSVISQNQVKDKKICSTTSFWSKIGLQNLIIHTFVTVETKLTMGVLVVTKSSRYTIQKNENSCLDPCLCLEF